MPVASRTGIIAGVDEAGRGPLAGPVVAAAVVLAQGTVIEDLADSKLVEATDRERLCEEIVRRAAAWGVGWSDPAEIDAVNILQATMLAMRRALAALRVPPERVLVDGNRLPDLEFFSQRLVGESIIGGDATVPAISAASILAKVTRDDMMRRYDAAFPGYGFAQHKGYGTKRHLRALQRHGPCVQHRQSFRPVREVLPASRASASDAAGKYSLIRVTIPA